MSRCVETNLKGFQCTREGPHSHAHLDTNGVYWSATKYDCSAPMAIGWCARDDDHSGEHRAAGWLAPANLPVAVSPAFDPEYLLWAGSLVGVLVTIGQLAATRAEHKQKGGSWFSWIEVD